MPLFQAEDCSIHYVDAGSGSPLVLVHGWPVSSVYWTADIERLAARFRVLALDLPGFGQSSCVAKQGASSYQQAHRVADFIRGVAGGPVFLVGHSMGGMVSARLAAAEPDLVKRLVLVAAPIEGATALSPFCQLSRWAWARWLATLLLKFQPVRRFAAPYFVHSIGLPDSILLQAALASAPSARLALGALTSEGDRSDVAVIRCPTLVIAADRDRIVASVQPLIAKAWIPGARLEVFRDCGHCPNLEHPEPFHRLLAEFLAE
ncbi:MAG: alpha/beta hydrolase [Candidatus Wallbacteria bacterium]|nr:alpha/beta hydrolase [Candidatus Wallbacteria bacterium]